MKDPQKNIDSMISAKGRDVSSTELGCSPDAIQVVNVNGGYSRNRRSLVGYENKWIFAKEVDLDLLPDDGVLELDWLRKDYECAKFIRRIIPEIVPEWGKLVADNHVFLMPSYRIEDGWLWTLPDEKEEQIKYIQAVIGATKKLESIKFDKDAIDKLNLYPYFRDVLALDDGLRLVIRNEEVRDQLIAKYSSMAQDKSLVKLQSAIDKMLTLLKDENALNKLAARAAMLINQPNDCFGHCDVRSDNIAYNSSTGQVKFVDWNWASFAPRGFGATEFLTDMSRRGIDVTPWLDDLNIELLAAMVGPYLRRCLKEPLAPGSALRDMQAQSAAVALDLYIKILNCDI